MWIICWWNLETNDYNFVARELKKNGFIPRKVAPMVFIKASILHICEKRSWRNIASELGCEHIYLYNFYQNFKNTDNLKTIFHRFIDKRVLLYIGEKKHFNRDFLNNNPELIQLTKQALASMMTRI